MMRNRLPGELDDLGILSGVDGMGLSLTGKSTGTDKFESAILTSDVALFIKHADASKTWSISACGVTKLGNQILQLAGAKPAPSYLKAIGNDIKKRGFEVLIGNYFRDGNQIIMPKLESF